MKYNLNQWVFFLKGPTDLRKDFHCRKLAATDGNNAFDHVLVPFDFVNDFIFQIHNFQRPPLQKQSCSGQRDAASASVKKRSSKLLLQRRQLSGKGGLGYMQLFRSLSKALLLCHSQKITQYSQFHRCSASVNSTCYNVL